MEFDPVRCNYCGGGYSHSHFLVNATFVAVMCSYRVKRATSFNG